MENILLICAVVSALVTAASTDYITAIGGYADNDGLIYTVFFILMAIVVRKFKEDMNGEK